MVYGVAGIERYYTFKGIPASPALRLAVESLYPHERLSFDGRFFLCHIVPNHRTFIEDYLKIVEFIEWLKDFYPEKAAFLTKKS